MHGILSRIRPLLFLLILSLGYVAIAEETHETRLMQTSRSNPVKKAVIIGDSMAGWLGERLNAYGQQNGFEVGTIVWDGATIQKYADAPGLKRQIEAQNPQVVFVCLGMNNLAEPNPSKLKSSIDKIRDAIGPDRELVWIGPPSWPGKPGWTALNNWLESEIGKNRYFNSYPLKLERQSQANPHPTKNGMMVWGDAITEWLDETDIPFPSLEKPKSSQMARGKFFLYKRMKETL